MLAAEEERAAVCSAMKYDPDKLGCRKFKESEAGTDGVLLWLKRTLQHFTVEIIIVIKIIIIMF